MHRNARYIEIWTKVKSSSVHRNDSVFENILRCFITQTRFVRFTIQIEELRFFDNVILFDDVCKKKKKQKEKRKKKKKKRNDPKELRVAKPNF